MTYKSPTVELFRQILRVDSNRKWIFGELDRASSSF